MRTSLLHLAGSILPPVYVVPFLVPEALRMLKTVSDCVNLVLRASQALRVHARRISD